MIRPVVRTEWWKWKQAAPDAYPNITTDLITARCDIYDSLDGRSCWDWSDPDPNRLLELLREHGWELEEGWMVCPRHGGES